MKVRIQGNSIRYRLRQPEVENLKVSGSVTEVIELGPAPTDQLRFVLKRSAVAQLSVQHFDKTTIVHIPEQWACEWGDSDVVGYDAAVDLGNGDVLKILVEKDFKCLDGSEADNVGAYPNPAEYC